MGTFFEADGIERAAFAGLIAAGAVLPLSLALKDLSLGVMVLAWLVTRAGRRQPSLPRAAATLPLLLWCGASLLSMVNSVNLGASVGGLKKAVIATAIVVATAALLSTPRRVILLFAAVMVGGVLASADGLVQVIRGRDLLYGRAAGIGLDVLPRLTGAFGHANDFGVYAAGVLPICIAMALGATTRAGRRAAWGVTALLSLALALTFSRPAALGLAVGLPLFCLVRPRAQAWGTLTMLVLLVVGGLLLLPSPVRAWVTSQHSWFDALVLPERPQMWRTAMNMITAHPWIGVGTNTFVLNYLRYRPPGDTLQPAYAHNHFLHMAAEIGLIGLAAFGLVVLSALLAWRRHLRSPDERIRLLSTGMGCGLVSFLAVGLLESALYSSHTNLCLWVWLGALHGRWPFNRLLTEQVHSGRFR